jgi:hypothetical protein
VLRQKSAKDGSILKWIDTEARAAAMDALTATEKAAEEFMHIIEDSAKIGANLVESAEEEAAKRYGHKR